jgi:hypothetical protein
MKAGNVALIRDLKEIASLLRKYQNYGQAKVVEEILAALNTSRPDYELLRGTRMWGGAGAVWETCLSTTQTPEDSKAGGLAFRRAFVRLVDTMNHMEIGTERSRFIGATFQSWIDKGL